MLAAALRASKMRWPVGFFRRSGSHLERDSRTWTAAGSPASPCKTTGSLDFSSYTSGIQVRSWACQWRDRGSGGRISSGEKTRLSDREGEGEVMGAAREATRCFIALGQRLSSSSSSSFDFGLGRSHVNSNYEGVRRGEIGWKQEETLKFS